MSPDAEALAASLREAAGKRKRLDLADLWHAFAAALPVENARATRRRHLADLLAEVQAAGHIAFPKGQGADVWDRAAAPALPAWVGLTAAAGTATRPRPVHAWAPELAFLADGFHAEQIDLWMALDRWLKAGGRHAPVAKAKERSYEVFGDEKLLEHRLLKLAPFRDGRISLDTLRCQRFPEPLPYTPGEAGLPCLVVENATTWGTLSEHNARFGLWSAVVYGSGNAFSTGWEGLPRIARLMRTASALYFGDIDQAGFDIPCGAIAALAQAGITLDPCVELYEALLAAGGNGRAADKSMTLSREAYGWLGDALGDRILALFARGRWLPQEALSARVLAQDPAWDLEADDLPDPALAPSTWSDAW